MKATQSNTALELLESTELLSQSDPRSLASRRSVSRRLDFGVVDVPQNFQCTRSSGITGADSRCGGLPSMGVAEGAGLAHDAGNLLSALSIYSELLAMPGVLNEEYRGYVAELRLLSERSSAMLSRLFQRVNEVKAEASCRWTPLSEVVTNCHGLLNRIAGRPLELIFSYGSSRLVSVQRETIKQVEVDVGERTKRVFAG